MQDVDISFSTRLINPQLGDEAACFVLTDKRMHPRGFVTRQGYIIGIIRAQDGTPVAYVLQDSVSGEEVCVAEDMLFIPEGNN